jgi:putative PIN family toxin of toxin-antitoxin system
MPAEDKPHRARVVIDTNVWVSGLTFQGRPREVLDLVWKNHLEAYISPFILMELERTLLKDFNWSKKQVSIALQKNT